MEYGWIPSGSNSALCKITSYFFIGKNIETTSSHLDGYINIINPSFPCFDDPQELGSHPTFDHESQQDVGA